MTDKAGRAWRDTDSSPGSAENEPQKRSGGRRNCTPASTLLPMVGQVKQRNRAVLLK